MQDDVARPFSQTFVTAFARGLAVIQAFEGRREPLGLTEIAARAGVDRAVARRSMLTLIELGFARFENKRYRLTPAILKLGHSYLSHCGMDGIFQHYVEDLVRVVDMSCSVTILDQGETVSIAHAPAPNHRVGFLSKPGTRMPAFVMTSGRLLLSGKSDAEVAALLEKMDRKKFTPKTRTGLSELMDVIRDIRVAGYATIDGELEMGMMSLAVPVKDRRGQMVASLNVSASAARTTLEEMCRTCLPVMRQTVEELSRVLP